MRTCYKFPFAVGQISLVIIFRQAHLRAIPINPKLLAKGQNKKIGLAFLTIKIYQYISGDVMFNSSLQNVHECQIMDLN